MCIRDSLSSAPLQLDPGYAADHVIGSHNLQLHFILLLFSTFQNLDLP